MSLFYISAPYLFGSRDGTIKEIIEVALQKKMASGKELSSFDRSKFKLANLDTLMFCNDKILKLEGLVESFLKKIDKQYLQMTESVSHEWFIRLGDKQILVKKYFYEIRWNDNKYPRNYPISKLVELFELKLNTVQNELRTKTNAYNETKIQLNQSTQKEGNYNVKDLTDVLVEPLVSKNDFIFTKFITTVVVIVPATSINEFKTGYEMYTENVIPYSAKQLKVPEKDGLTIWVVSLFNVKLDEEEEEIHEHDDVPAHKAVKKQKRVLTPAQEFTQAARDKLKLVVKEFSFESGLSVDRKKKKQSLQTKLKAQTKAVADVCLAYFSEMYELYIHCKLLRIVVESNMRFGSDPTVIYCIQAIPGKEKTVQGLLIEIFGDKENEGLYGTKDQIDDGEDFFPFVYVPALSFQV